MSALQAVSLAGSGVSAYQSIEASSQEADLTERKGWLQMDQATEAQAAGDKELATNFSEGQKIQGQQTSAYAKGGVDLSGTPLSVLENTKYQIDKQALDIQRATANRVRMYRAGANITLDQAGDTRNAGVTNATATLLGGAGRAYGNADPKSGNANMSLLTKGTG